MNVVVLTVTDVRELLTMEEAIEANRRAYIALARREVDVPLRHHIRTQKGVGLVMPGYVPNEASFGLKFVSVMPENRSRGLPVTVGVVMLLDPETGAPLAFMDGTYLTALRTGAGTGVATDLLAVPTAKTMTLIGTGGQADAQLRAVLSVRPVERVFVYNRTRARAEEFCRRHAGAVNRNGRPVALSVVDDLERAVRESQIVVTATNASTPVLLGEWLAPGTHVNAIGSHDREGREVDEEVVIRSRVIAVDFRPGAMMAGDLAVPLDRGRIKESDLVEIGTIAAGDVPGRINQDDITFFKSVGHAVQDLVVAKLVYERARQRGMGKYISLD